MGDAEELGYDEELLPPRNRFASTESLAVASLALSVCAFLSGGMFQYLFFVIGDSINDEGGQYMIYAAPMAVFAALAIALGSTAARRETTDRWTAGLAGAGVIVGGVTLVITVIGGVLALTLGDSPEPQF
jgi:hypothetical protein